MQGASTGNVAIRADFPSSLDLKRLSLAIYHGDPACAERCRDATLLVILAQLRERRVDVREAISKIVELRRCDFSAGNGMLVIAGMELQLRRDWLSAAMRWLVFRGLREGPLFLAMSDGTVVDRALQADDIPVIVEGWSHE